MDCHQGYPRWMSGAQLHYFGRAASGAPADRAAFEFELSHGAVCVGACWALMLLPLLAGQGHVLTMLAVMPFAFAERLEDAAPLAWRWRGPAKALRIAAAQARMYLTYPKSGPLPI